MNLSPKVVQTLLLGWYDAQARDLPWRRQPSLYRTVVSEFMLQQTQVATVLPYFERWMQALPDFEALAQASQEQVLKLWEGLGYYRRARYLHALAQQWIGLPEAERPQSAKAWQRLPGVGPYIAAAVASICFDEPTTVVDGNVVRVLARLTHETQLFANAGAATTFFRPQALALIEGCTRPGDFNQALMELGATVCRKAKPQCPECPLKGLCLSVGHGPEGIPGWQRVKAVCKTIERAVVTRTSPQPELLLRRIPGDAKRLAGLWEFPAAQAVVAPDQLAGVLASRPLWTKRRGIANERITEPYFAAETAQLVAPTPPECAWVTGPELAELPLAGPHRKLANGPLQVHWPWLPASRV